MAFLAQLGKLKESEHISLKLSPYQDRSNYDLAHLDLYRTIEWSVGKYKALVQGIGEGFYDDPKYLQNDECLNKEAMELIFNLLEVYNHSSSYLDAFFKLGTGLVTL